MSKQAVPAEVIKQTVITRSSQATDQGKNASIKHTVTTGNSPISAVQQPVRLPV